MPRYGHGEIFRLQQRRVERLPSGRVVHYADYGAKLPPDAVWAVCDCCCGHYDRLWRYQQYGFATLQPRRVFEAGKWGLCVECQALFAQGRFDLLVARVCTLNPDVARADIERLYTLLPFVLHGKPEEWVAGA